MRKYVMIFSLVPCAIVSVALTIVVMRGLRSHVGLPNEYLTVTFAILCSVIMGVPTGTCFGLLGLRLVRRQGRILIVDLKDPRFEEFTRTPLWPRAEDTTQQE